MSNFVYMLRCADGSLYTGWTNDPEARLAAHLRGTASKYTRSRRPLKMVYLEQTDTKSSALRREIEIKALPKKKKEALIRSEL